MSEEGIESIKNKLNSIGPGFCLAKWLQVTVHLQLGHTHSCHHPDTHKVPLNELVVNPSALHNTEFKKQIRQEMLDGKKPKECHYCWKIEDLPGEQISDRYLKSNDSWAAPYFDEVIEAGSTGNINPRYLEVSFSNKCNFKCAYCMPAVSSKWMSEIVQHGPYPTDRPYNDITTMKMHNKMPIEDEDSNPYVKSFWEWMPKLYPDLKVFRVTGGEPLLSKSTFKLLDYILDHPKPDLDFCINTNLGIPHEILKQFVQRVSEVNKAKAVQKIYIYTSLDTYGEQAEIIRDGLELELFKKNLYYLLDNLENIKLTFMCTFNVLSIPNFSELIKFILSLKCREYEKESGNIIFIDISYLSYPQFLSVKIAPPELALKYLEPVINFMEENSQYKIGTSNSFHGFEIVKLQRLLEYIKKETPEDERNKDRRDFKKFTDEYEKRRKVNFKKSFPEFLDFFDANEKI